MKRILLLLGLSAITFCGISQEAHTDQNGIKTSVVRNLTANATQAKRYEIAKVAMNSHHWQGSGFMIVELFSVRPYTGYEKYKIQIGYGEGTNSTPKKIKLLESHGAKHFAKLELGSAYPAGTTYGGYENMMVPIYVDVAYYSVYNVRMTYVYNKVDVLNSTSQIKIYDSPVGVDIANFIAPVVDHSDENFAMKNGVLSENLNVTGTITAAEIKVQAQTADFVFEEDYQLKSLNEVEQFINTNKHLPDIPSAKAMKEDGVGLAEMNKLLLQKVEELTLYMIEQKQQTSVLFKVTKSIEEENKELKAEIELLKAK